MTILETGRLRLREMLRSDMPALKKILQDPDVMYAYEGSFSDTEVDAWYERQRHNYFILGFGLWAVVLKETGEMIGQCGLTMQDYKDNKVLEIGYHLQKEHWHRGYATEAAIACRDYAFVNLNAGEVFSIVRDTNIPSQNVAKRCGMEIRDEFVKHYRRVDMPHVLYSVRKDNP